MSYISIILLVIAVLNLYLAGFVFFRNRHSPSNFYYSLMLLCGTVWILGLFGYSLTFNAFHPFARLALINILYIGTLLASFYYFIFTCHFPYPTFKLPKWLRAFLYALVFGLAALLSLKPDFLIDLSILETNMEMTHIMNYLVFSLVFGAFVIAGFVVLLKKYFKAEGVSKRQIGYVLWGTALTYVLASITNLLPSFWNSYSTYWLGPVFTLINVSFIALLIFRNK